MAPLNLVLLGKQGAGKGTQGQRLCATYGLAHISTGNILRAAVAADSVLGREVAAVLDAGALVSDELVNELVKNRFGEPDASRGALLDGYPRTLAQGEALEAVVGATGLALVINLDLPDDLVIARISSRRVCQECATVYRDSDVAAISGTCEKCGGDVVQRSDDRPEAIEQRLEMFRRDTVPLFDFYAARALLVTVNGDQSPDAVTADIESRLRERGVA